MYESFTVNITEDKVGTNRKRREKEDRENFQKKGSRCGIIPSSYARI